MVKGVDERKIEILNKTGKEQTNNEDDVEI